MIGEKIVAPDLLQKITAYRTWELLNNRLIPLSRTSSTWDKKVQTAECRSGNSCTESPSSDCHCGLYGFFKLDKALKQSLGVIGVTEHWGKTEVHKDGLRSQYASIKALSYAPQKITPIWFVRNPILAVLIMIGITSALIISLTLIVALISSATISLLEIVLVVPAAFIIISIAFIFLYMISGQSFFKKIHFEIFIKQIKYLFISESKKKEHLKFFCEQNNIVYVEDYRELKQFCNSTIPEEVKSPIQFNASKPNNTFKHLR